MFSYCVFGENIFHVCTSPLLHAEHCIQYNLRTTTATSTSIIILCRNASHARRCRGFSVGNIFRNNRDDAIAHYYVTGGRRKQQLSSDVYRESYGTSVCTARSLLTISLHTGSANNVRSRPPTRSTSTTVSPGDASVENRSLLGIRLRRIDEHRVTDPRVDRSAQDFFFILSGVFPN